MHTKARWYYDELKQIGTDYANIEEVEAYDAHRSEIRDIKTEINEIKTALNLQKDHVILDIGTGTGAFAIELSKSCKHVYACDISPVMLKYAHMKTEKYDRKNIGFLSGGFLTFDLPVSSVDAVLTQLSLHHLPDFWKLVALKRIYDILVQGGRLFIRDVVFPSKINDYRDYLNTIVNNLRQKSGETNAAAMEHHIRDEYSTFDWIMEGLFQKAGFTLEQAHYYNGFLATYICVK